MILVMGLGTVLQVNIHVLFILLALVLRDADHTTTTVMCLRSESLTSESLYVVRHTCSRAIRREDAMGRVHYVHYVKQSVDLFNTLRTGSFKLFKSPFPGFYLTILTL